MDRTILNLASLLLGAAGIFTVLSGYNGPELRTAFGGENPFLVKQDAINGWKDRLFMGVAVLAVLIQAVAEVFGASIEDRSHGWRLYLVAFGTILVIIASLWFGIVAISVRLARREWFEPLAKVFRPVLSAAERDFAEMGFVEAPGGNAFVSDAIHQVELMEKLFDARSHGALPERVLRLRKILGPGGTARPR